MLFLRHSVHRCIADMHIQYSNSCSTSTNDNKSTTRLLVLLLLSIFFVKLANFSGVIVQVRLNRKVNFREIFGAWLVTEAMSIANRRCLVRPFLLGFTKASNSLPETLNLSLKSMASYCALNKHYFLSRTFGEILRSNFGRRQTSVHLHQHGKSLLYALLSINPLANREA